MSCGGNDGCIGPQLFEHAEGVQLESHVVRVRANGLFVHQERPDVVGEEILVEV